MKTFESDNGFYRLEYPENLNLSYEENVLNIFPDDKQSALTVSSHHFDNGVDVQDEIIDQYQTIFESIINLGAN